MGIETKSLGALIDELITCDIKCWYAQEDVKNATNDAEAAAAGRRAQETNGRRNELMRAIDEKFGDPSKALGKTYWNGEKVLHTREELLEAHLTGLCDQVLHQTDSVFMRQLAQDAWDYLVETNKKE